MADTDPPDFGPQPTGWNDPPQLYFYTCALRALYRSDDTTRRTVMSLAGRGTYLEQAAPDPVLPRWMAQLYTNGTLLVVVTGTQTLDQWAFNLNSSIQAGALYVPGEVHQYFADVAGELGTQLAAALGNVWPAKVTLTGHSLGGAVAQIMAYQFNNFRPGSVQMVATFGSPKVGNLQYATGNAWPVCRIQNYGDPIIQAPPSTRGTLTSLVGWGECDHYVHAGRGFTLHINGSMDREEPQGVGDAVVGLLANIGTHGATGWFPHLAVLYANHLVKWMQPRFRQGRWRGIVMGPVDHFQRRMAALEGFVWEVRAPLRAGSGGANISAN